MAGRGTNSVQAFNKQAIKDIKKAIDNLPKEFSLTKRRNILKKGIEPFLESARVKAPKKTGDLALSIDTKTFRNNKNYVFGGVMTKKKIKIGGSVGSEVVDGFYAKFLEYGFTHIAYPKKGATIKKGLVYKSQLTEVAPKPFLRPAWDATNAKLKKTTEKLIEKRTNNYLKKVDKR